MSVIDLKKVRDDRITRLIWDSVRAIAERFARSTVRRDVTDEEIAGLAQQRLAELMLRYQPIIQPLKKALADMVLLYLAGQSKLEFDRDLSIALRLIFDDETYTDAAMDARHAKEGAVSRVRAELIEQIVTDKLELQNARGIG